MNRAPQDRATSRRPASAAVASRADTNRAYGRVQVTYNDHLLFFYVHEGKREVKCNDTCLAGGHWHVVRPNGNAAPLG